jgi:hypothetical protein
MIKETKVPTLGEQVFEWSLETKPANTSEEIKELFVKVLNLMGQEYQQGAKHPMKSLLFDHALGEVVNAQLAVNKVLTIKHYTENENSREEIIAE